MVPDDVSLSRISVESSESTNLSDLKVKWKKVNDDEKMKNLNGRFLKFSSRQNEALIFLLKLCRELLQKVIYLLHYVQNNLSLILQDLVVLIIV